MTSRPYSLRPAGLRTIEAESLTSYVRRLATAHVVSPSTLLRDAVLNRCGRPAVSGISHSNRPRAGESLNSGASSASRSALWFSPLSSASAASISRARFAAAPSFFNAQGSGLSKDDDRALERVHFDHRALATSRGSGGALASAALDNL